MEPLTYSNDTHTLAQSPTFPDRYYVYRDDTGETVGAVYYRRGQYGCWKGNTYRLVKTLTAALNHYRT